MSDVEHQYVKFILCILYGILQNVVDYQNSWEKQFEQMGLDSQQSYEERLQKQLAFCDSSISRLILLLNTNYDKSQLNADSWISLNIHKLISLHETINESLEPYQFNSYS